MIWTLFIAVVALGGVSAFPTSNVGQPFGSPSQAIYAPSGGGVIFPQGAVSPMQQPAGQIPHAQLIPADSAMVERATGGKKGRCNVYYYCCIFYCWAKWTPCGCYLVCADSGGPALPPTAIDHAVTNEFFDPPSPTAPTPPRADIAPGYTDDIDKVSPDDERHPPLQDIGDTHPDTPSQPIDNNYTWQEDPKPTVPVEDEPDPYEPYPFYDDQYYPDPYYDDEPYDPEYAEEPDPVFSFGQLQGQRPLVVRFPQTGVTFEAKARSADNNRLQRRHLSEAKKKRKRTKAERAERRRLRKLRKQAKKQKQLEQQQHVDNKFAW